MTLPFTLINDLIQFLKPLKVAWFVSGGWAIDLYLNRATRERGDLDISVPFADCFAALDFFLEKDWQIEGKLRGGFKTLHKISDYDEQIHYFWSFPKKAKFISEYVDEDGQRRIAYNRKVQHELDYIEVFFDRIEDQSFIYRREPQLKRRIEDAIMERDGVRYLAPEIALLFKSNSLTEKNQLDFDVALPSLAAEAKTWLANALLLLYGNSHRWLEQLD